MAETATFHTTTLSCTSIRGDPTRTTSGDRNPATSAQAEVACKTVVLYWHSTGLADESRYCRVGSRKGLADAALDKGLQWQRLRPAFGSGEDWNMIKAASRMMRQEVAPGLRVGRGLELGTVDHKEPTPLELRPAFGSGEDWNLNANLPLVLNGNRLSPTTQRARP
jgi:hypothetical protein